MINDILNSDEMQPFVRMIQNYDYLLYEHSINVAEVSEHIASYLIYPDQSKEEIVKGALLHDIGKTFVPVPLLNKNSFLTENEMNVMKNHPAYGYKIIKEFDFSEIVTDIVRFHHENEMGTGYPYHSTMMTMETQIVSVADKYDAMISMRPYKSAMQKSEVLSELLKCCDRLSNGKLIFRGILDYTEFKSSKELYL